MSPSPDFQGWSTYIADSQWSFHRLLVAVPCIIAGWPIPLDAMLDTGAEWCVLPGELAAALREPTGAGEVVGLATRLGTFHGRLQRFAVRFPAEVGDPVTVEATWFVCEECPGPPVLGWRGCLERIRFAIDPGERRFYFGEL
jgi:hypothetical protein